MKVTKNENHVIPVSIAAAFIGRRGGRCCFERHGTEFYQRIGAKGGKVTQSRYGFMARDWGRLGGRPRKPKLGELTGEESK